MRVLYLLTKADMGGAQIHVLDLLRGLRGLQEAAVGVGEKGYFTKAVEELGVPCYVLPNLVHPVSPLTDLRAVADVARLIRFVAPHIMHAHTSKAGVIGRLAARVAGVPSVFTAHTWCFAEGTSWKWRLGGIPAERLAGWFSSTIINVSDANRHLALRYRVADERRLVTIWNGIPDTRYRAKPGASAAPSLVMVARCVPQKDHILLLRVLARMHRPLRASIVGDGPLLPALQQASRQLRLGDRVEFLGSRSDVPQILSKAAVVALPTHWEGFPLSILEAMRAGLPVIASNVGGVSEAVVEGQTGFLVDRGDEEGFRRRLENLADDAALRARMGAAARRRYESQFTLKHMLDKTMAVYRSVNSESQNRSLLQGIVRPARAGRAGLIS